MIFIENRRKKDKTLNSLYPKAKVIDVTSNSNEPYIRLSPFYPHGNIPIPFSKNYFSYSVEGIWQGLKVFEKSDIDKFKFTIQNMRGIKRTEMKFGEILGHRKGVESFELLGYLEARKKIYIPSYRWVLENKVRKELKLLIDIALKYDLVLLDYETNCDIENITKPLSHAGLLKFYIEEIYSDLSEKKNKDSIKVNTLKTNIDLQIRIDFENK